MVVGASGVKHGIDFCDTFSFQNTFVCYIFDASDFKFKDQSIPSRPLGSTTYFNQKTFAIIIKNS